ncbi:hypothetical protein BDQ12DRAFT_737259 [Crucibulum laeve]|uniref:Nephrocystin 3-like N-terminal domain-containing protein n=1 Tax=Crucibulum laeve TaxID=68775 RepID=A0A5C3M4F0_9AGAR|nr:hypothetical protein BDQ12DRAFT_737259 [Crucibulum laeve]
MSFWGANNITINGLTQYDIQFQQNTPNTSTTNSNGFEYLRASIAPGAFHNSSERFDPPKCHPETRKAVLQTIIAWVEDRSRASPIMWLYGPAGAGKSAIAQSIAELCEAKNNLSAAFFFSRTVAERNTEAHLFATIVYQIALNIPPIKPIIAAAIENDLTIFSRSLYVQIQTLIVQPCRTLLERLPTASIQDWPQLIIIDGLDECLKPEIQASILEALSVAISQSNIPFCILVDSRPEQAIRTAFNVESLNSLTTRLALDDTFDPDKDIELFLRSKFTDIRQSHSARPFSDAWPSDSAVNTLVARSSGQFIYASVVMKYVSDPRHLPVRRLNVILGLSDRGNDTPYAQLDLLYSHILSTVEDFENTSRVLGALIYLANGDRCERLTIDLLKSPPFLDEFLVLENSNTCLLLSDLHSMLSVPENSSTGLPIRFFHASFSDFLLDSKRSNIFYLSQGKIHADLAWCTLLNVSHHNAFVSSYANAYMFHHLSRSSPNIKLLKRLHSIDFISVFKSQKVPTSNNSDIIPSNMFEADMVSTLQQFTSLTKEDPSLVQITNKLQAATDQWHLMLLNKTRYVHNLPIYLLLGNILGGDIYDYYGGGRDHASVIIRKVCGTSHGVAFEAKASTAPLGLFSDILDHYRQWLLDFLLTPSRAGKYSMSERHYQHTSYVLIEMFNGIRGIGVNDDDVEVKRDVARVLRILLPRTAPSNQIAELVHKMNTDEVIEMSLHADIRKYLEKCDEGRHGNEEAISATVLDAWRDVDQTPPLTIGFAIGKTSSRNGIKRVFGKFLCL